MRQPPPVSELPRYPVVAVTAALAVAASIAYWAGRDVSFLFEDPRVREGQIWRFVTSMFPHGDLIHLAFNLYWLWVFGSLVEAMFGRLATAAIIIVLALASGAAQYALLEGGIGLSGVGYGLFGMLWVLGRRDGRFHDAVDAQTVNIFVAWFFICVVATYLGLMNVGNVAHGAGAAAGALIGLAVASGAGRRMLPTAALALFVAASVFGATIARDRINLSPHLGDDEFQLGYDALGDEDYVAAEKWLLRATRLQPDNAIFWYDVALAQAALGKFEESSASFERAYRLDPNDEDFKQAYERSGPRVGNTPLPRVITTMPANPSEPPSDE